MLNILRQTIIIDAEEDGIQVGDQIFGIQIEGFGIFTATVEEITDDSILFIFDDIVAIKPMNETGTNVGGFKESQLYEWLQNTLLPRFSAYWRKRISELTIPTTGQVSGWSDLWSKEYFESDNNRQLPLMKDRKHRIASLEGNFESYWLQNATKKDYSASHFAYMSADGGVATYLNASASRGVRPAFRLVREKSGGHAPSYNRVSEMPQGSFLKMTRKYDEGTKEMKDIMDSCIRAGFSEEQAFHIVMNLITTTIFRGVR